MVVSFCSINILAQSTEPVPDRKTHASQPQSSTDDLFRHLNAAEVYQRAGNLDGAAMENQAVLDIALQRFGNLAIEEGKYADAIEHITESLKFSDTSAKRTTLAVTYLRQNLLDKALAEAKTAVALDPTHAGSRYILSNIFYTKEDYENALPELEWTFSQVPDFEIGRALGLTYLNLKQIEKARLHFKKLHELTGGEKAGLHVLFARLYERTNYPVDAERELRSALRLEPQRPKINFYLGYLLMQHGGSERLDEARTFFEKELKIVPDDFYALFFSGVAAVSQNKYEEAMPFLKKAIAVNSQSGEAHLFLAQAQIGMGELTDAEKNLRRAIELEARSEGKNTQARRTHFMLGRLLLQTGRKEEGKKELEIAAELQKKSLDNSRSEVNKILGEVVEDNESKADEKASMTFNTQINLSPERIVQIEKLKPFLTEIIAQSYNNLGVIATQRSLLDKAFDHFSAAYQWKPDLSNLARNFGIISFRINEFAKAVNPLTLSLEKNPQDILVRKMLGSSFYLTGNFAKAIEVLKPIEAQLITDAELAYFYGISLIQSKRDREAALVFERLSNASQDDAETLFYAAQGFMMMGNHERAVSELERLISIAPNTSKANYFMGQSLIRLNRAAEAEKAFERELAINPADGASKYHLAFTLIERKIQTERAIKLLEETLVSLPSYADAYYQLGKIHLEKGELQKAVENLEKGVAADAEKDYIHYQLSIAYRKMSRTADADRELEIYQKLKREKRDAESPAPMGKN